MSNPLTEIEVVVAGPEEAFDGIAEFWCNGELLGITTINEGPLHLRIYPRGDGSPWLIDAASLARALVEAPRQLAAY
jgi:hypothetical protein